MKNSSLSSHRPLSGQLYKYTNVVKGWQQRWFAVDPETGVLSYYLFDGPGDTVQPGQPARGEVKHFSFHLITRRTECNSSQISRYPMGQHLTPAVQCRKAVVMTNQQTRNVLRKSLIIIDTDRRPTVLVCR